MNIKCNHCGWIGKENDVEHAGDIEYCPKWEKSDALMDIGEYVLYTNNPLDIPVSTAELQSALDYLLDIAEKYYPQYSSDDEIAVINDFYKKHLG